MGENSRADEIAAAYERLIQRFVNWAEAEENIRAALVIGSRARVDHPADEWSDLDVTFLANDPQPYVVETDWLSTIGQVWLSFLEMTPDGEAFERRVLFEGGLDVDFVPSSISELRQMLDKGLTAADAEMIRRGVRVILDKDGDLAKLDEMEVKRSERALPSQAEFLNVVNDFWYHTVWTAKHLRRGELWWGKSCCDGYLKGLLLRGLEWHALASRGPHTDTWMRGRFLEEWADPRAVESLSATFAHYDEADVWRALQATMELFRWLAEETAELFGYGYPSDGAEHAEKSVGKLFSERR
jgi:aminoglycoside 6-adenylyltransferase